MEGEEDKKTGEGDGMLVMQVVQQDQMAAAAALCLAD